MELQGLEPRPPASAWSTSELRRRSQPAPATFGTIHTHVCSTASDRLVALCRPWPVRPRSEGPSSVGPVFLRGPGRPGEARTSRVHSPAVPRFGRVAALSTRRSRTGRRTGTGPLEVRGVAEPRPGSGGRASSPGHDAMATTVVAHGRVKIHEMHGSERVLEVREVDTGPSAVESERRALAPSHVRVEHAAVGAGSRSSGPKKRQSVK